MSITRLASIDDAEALEAQVRANREFLEPWEPLRDESYYTLTAQREQLSRALDSYAVGSMMPLVIVDDDDQLIGRLNINSIIRGAFQSASLGYWVAQSQNGRGVATRAVAEAVEIAFGQLDLHRLQGETLPSNVASQRVLESNGFIRYGFAPTYIKIAGQWQDNVLYQLINPRPM
jgi:ribosomal-protein-alanine N-acetyltransferase